MSARSGAGLSDSSVPDFWRRASAKIPALAGRLIADVFSFGDGELADRILRLVLDGVKTATAALPMDFGSQRPIPRPGDLSVVLDGSGRPRCVIETTELRRLAASAVDAAFVLDYGEGDRTLDWWRANGAPYYAKLAGQADAELELLCERFRVVYAEP